MLPSAERAELFFAPGITVRFADRAEALEFFSNLAKRGSRLPVVIYGPEGCGKSALLRQASLILEGEGYEVLYIDPLSDISRAVEGTARLKDLMIDALRAVTGDLAVAVAKLAFSAASKLLRAVKGAKLALLLDDVFQVIGLRVAESYVKQALNLIEYPPEPYESIVVVITTSEGVSRKYLGRHAWCSNLYLWNMCRGGFEELYAQLPGEKPEVGTAWRLTGGNPRMLSVLHTYGWDASRVVDEIIEGRNLRVSLRKLSAGELALLEEALKDPDVLWRELPSSERLLEVLVELNMVSEIPERSRGLWIDTPPREDRDLGIGKYVAWQTPLHREAVRRALTLK